MKPILYESTETQFTSNGLGRLADCIECTVTEERNGIYECQLVYPVTGEMASSIQIGRILGVIHDDAKDIQPFDIYARSAPLDGAVTFYAHHISYRLGHVILKPMEATSCAAALSAIPSNTYNTCLFSFWTDKAVSATWQNKTPAAVKAVLGGQQGSILDVYGKGEYKWDKWLVRLYTNRGNDNGVSIRYGVNLTGLQQELDESGSYNAVAPYWVSREDGTVVTLSDGIVMYSGEGASESIVPVPLDLSDAFEEQPTEAQLRAEAQRRLESSEAWLPSENITVSFVNLADTEEYKNVAALQRVSLCDRVSVYCGPLGVSAVKMQVIRTVYNVLLERYDEIELGKAKATIAEAITAKMEALARDLTRDLPTTSMMQQAIDTATGQITGAMGGHVRFIYDANGKMQEILIMDTEDIATAAKIWRFNMGGMGFSRNGYGGPYTIAITQDGEIVADTITAGHMSANRIRGGVIDGTTVLAKLLNIVGNDGNVIASFDSKITLGLQSNYNVIIKYNSLSLRNAEDNSEIFFVGDTRNEEGYVDKHEQHVVKEGFYPSDGYIYLDNKVSNDSEPVVTVNGEVLNVYKKEGSMLYVKSNSGNTIAGQTADITYRTRDSVYYFTLGTRDENAIKGIYSFVEGFNNIAQGKYSHAEGNITTSKGDESHAEGYHTVAEGTASHAEGYGCSAPRIEGRFGHSTGNHAEGHHTVAKGTASHAEGYYTVAEKIASHAEGYYAVAEGTASHAEGYYTIARFVAQHVYGKFNAQDPFEGISPYGQYVEIVGNGADSDHRGNARTLDWEGNEWIAGALSVGNVQQTLINLGISGDSGIFVTGVKGANESAYRQGNVNLTPANIGAVNKAGDTMTGPLDIRQFLTAWAIELIPSVGSGIGGYIDFAFNGEAIDFTSRIIEGARGVLNINGITFDRANPFGVSREVG